MTVKTLGHIFFNAFCDFAEKLGIEQAPWETLPEDFRTLYEVVAVEIDFEPSDAIKAKQGWNPDKGWDILP